MQKQLLVAFLLLSFSGMAQRGLVFVKKKGIKRVALFAEGAPVSFLIQDYGKIDGVITLVSHDTIFINGLGFPARSVKTIFLPRRNDHLPNSCFTPPQAWSCAQQASPQPIGPALKMPWPIQRGLATCPMPFRLLKCYAEKNTASEKNLHCSRLICTSPVRPGPKR
jgi:hypothetical protein